jgi:hypothetical protein
MPEESPASRPTVGLTKRTAVLIVHGVGQQNKYETLARFAAGLKIQLEHAHGRAYAVQRFLRKLGSGVESGLRLHDPASATAGAVDMFEYYYQHKLQRQVTVPDAVEWLLRTAKRVRQLYRSYPIEQDQGNGKHARRWLSFAYMLADEGIFPWWLWPLSWLLPLLIHGVAAVGLLLRSWKLPVTNLAWQVLAWLLARLLRPTIVDFAGDVVAYTAIDPKLRLEAVRKTILDGCVAALKDLLAPSADGTRYDQVILAGHSLGSVVAYDAVMGIDNDEMAGLQVPAKLPDVHLVTFGSPLDKIAYFFWPVAMTRTAKKSYVSGAHPGVSRTGLEALEPEIQMGLLEHFHGIIAKGLTLRGEQPVVIPPKPPATEPLQPISWRNFFHPRDIIGGHLDAYRLVRNIRTYAGADPKNAVAARSKTRPGFPEAHSFYWYDPNLFDEIVNTPL